MVRSFLITLALAPVISFSANALGVSAVRDSVGVERKNGKLYVQHKVDPKETLYALSRKYSVPVSQIVEANPSVETTIRIGEIVLIPRKASAVPAPMASTAKAVPASNRTYTVNNTGNKLHTVEARQTLYSISKMYGVAVEDIRRWNGLADNSISIGSSLIVGKGTAQPTKQPVYVPEADDEMAKPRTTENVPTTPAPVSRPVGDTAPAEADAAGDASEAEESSTGLKKIIESGMAEMIDPKADSNKYLALHKSAPVGTIMQVKNAMNGQVVYVRVIGKLPDTGSNDKVLVRLSKKAYQKLGAIDNRFRVEVSYMP
ncbi:LysM peptidoglycan-binding domain-containing protein [Pontibacter sp. E15-1]|uniref:DPBB and LysM peptidoglycan-binding domain-containing protein n=1 Tax=Pontibacter sp. E15-1 TaxID=2919918 RepID=UPI001F503DCC|nr:LysM peptidoglycan-binding domain-containing protein [Pontibacter sp. E15-1]MCJ8163345.1 LysM peptidoglycan-binding domain-containing protein [Pontibacter sp. E15-1]